MKRIGFHKAFFCSILLELLSHRCQEVLPSAAQSRWSSRTSCSRGACPGPGKSSTAVRISQRCSSQVCLRKRLYRRWPRKPNERLKTYGLKHSSDIPHIYLCGLFFIMIPFPRFYESSRSRRAGMTANM